MAILPKGARPDSGPDSYDELDRELLAGFVVPGVELPFGQRKIAAGRLRARVTAVEYWISEGEQPSHKLLAERLGMSDRCLSYQFPKHRCSKRWKPTCRAARSWMGWWRFIVGTPISMRLTPTSR